MAAYKSNAILVAEIKELYEKFYTDPTLEKLDDRFNERIQRQYVKIYERLKVNDKL